MTSNETSNPSVAITGAGSGLGRELALKGIVKLFENACGAVDVSGRGGER
jgi:NAD(P)-dependent dehydrogenase (short-subunit alcohol dehydrogenase family)